MFIWPTILREADADASMRAAGTEARQPFRTIEPDRGEDEAGFW
jgi:hypothetical protein